MKYVNICKNSKLKEKTSKPNNKAGFKYKYIILTFIGIVASLAIAGLLFENDVKALFNPVTIVATINSAELKETDGRTNILILGSDKRNVGEITSVLTDTLLVASISNVDGEVTLISLPRDLWVSLPNPNSGYSKINAVYATGGVKDTTKVVENVLGIPLHYYAVIDFNIFRQVIDIMGGVLVTVDNSFTDYYYPVEGKEDAPLSERYETVHFDQGTQVMNGDTALKFVRSRKGDNNEGTDFARSARQQKVIMAVKDKALTLDTIINPTKLKELYDTYKDNVETNIGFTEIQNFYLLSQQIDFNKIKSIVLDDRSAADQGGLLYAPEDTSLYGGAYVLLPKAGNFSQLHAYVQKYIFGD